MIKKTNILYVHPNSEIGGSDIALLRMIRTLDPEAYRAVVVQPGPGPLSERLEGAGAAVHYSTMVQLRTLPSPIHQGRYLLRFWPTVRRLARLIRSESIDLVHTNSLFCLYGGWAARLARRPHLWHIREIPPNIPLARLLFARMVQALSDPVISMTRACTLGLWGRLDPPCRIIYLPEGLDLRQWHTSVSGGRIRQELGITNETPVVGFVARLDPWKGLDVFLRAAALVADRFPDALFLISGDSPEGFEPYRQRMMNLARDLGIGRQVLFLGWKYRLDDMPEFMGALDVFSHTATHPEPFGLVLIEAMSMGRPVVASRAGGPLEIVQEGKTGFLTPASDAAAHAQSVCRLLEDSQLAQEMGQAGRHRVEEEYSLEVFSRRVERIYQEAMFPPVEPMAADRKSVP